MVRLYGLIVCGAVLVGSVVQCSFAYVSSDVFDFTCYPDNVYEGSFDSFIILACNESQACSVDGSKVFLNSLWWWFHCKAGSPSDSVHTSFGLFPNTSWKGEKPATFCRLFLALKAQVRASSGEQLVSEIILSIMLASV